MRLITSSVKQVKESSKQKISHLIEHKKETKKERKLIKINMEIPRDLET